jgi:hypothetical protein
MAPTPAAAASVNQPRSRTRPNALTGWDWGKLSGGIGTIVVAAAGWANSMQGKVDTAIAKLEAVEMRLEKFEGKLERIVERLPARGQVAARVKEAGE